MDQEESSELNNNAVHCVYTVTICGALTPSSIDLQYVCREEKEIDSDDVDLCDCNPSEGMRCDDETCSNWFAFSAKYTYLSAIFLRAMNFECVKGFCPVEKAGFTCQNQRFQNASLRPVIEVPRCIVKVKIIILSGAA